MLEEMLLVGLANGAVSLTLGHKVLPWMEWKYKRWRGSTEDSTYWGSWCTHCISYWTGLFFTLQTVPLWEWDVLLVNWLCIVAIATLFHKVVTYGNN